MEKSAGMRVAHRFRDFLEIARGNHGIERSLFDPFGKAFAVDKLHRNEVHPLDLAELIDRHDIRVVQGRRGMRFVAKSGDLRVGAQAAVPDRLECDDSIQTDLSRFVDDSHSALRDLGEEFVVADFVKRTGRLE